MDAEKCMPSDSIKIVGNFKESSGKASYCETSNDSDEDFTINSKKPKVCNQGDIQI